jgi:hypothetical protein
MAHRLVAEDERGEFAALFGGQRRRLVRVASDLLCDAQVAEGLVRYLRGWVVYALVAHQDIASTACDHEW